MKERKLLNKDQAYGAIILVGSLFGVLAYGWLLYANPMIVLQVTAFVAVAGVLVILAWIGWTMATTPPPEPIDFETPSVPASAEAVEKPSGEAKSPRSKAES